MLFIVSRADEGAVLVHPVPPTGPVRLSVDLDSEEPTIVQAVFTRHTLLELGQTEGPFKAPSNPNKTLADLESTVLQLQLDDEGVGSWVSGEPSALARSLSLETNLCPELEYERLEIEGRFAVEMDENRVAVFAENELRIFEWTSAGLESRSIALDGETLHGLVGAMEDENTWWLGGSGLHRLVLEPRQLTTYANFAPHELHDFVLLRGGAEPRGLALTNDGELFELETSTVTSLGRIPGSRGGVGSGGLAVVANEGEVIAATAGGGVVFVHSALGLEEEVFPTTDNEGTAYAVTLANFGPAVVTRPSGELHLRTANRSWTEEVTLAGRSRTAADLGPGAAFFDTYGETMYYSRESGVCRGNIGPWAPAAGQGAPLGPHLVVNTLGQTREPSTWLVRRVQRQ